MFPLAIIQGLEDIEEKIQNAPDKGYEIGVFIGSMLPFVILVVVAYLIYRYAKVDRYQGRLASAGVAAISLTVCIVSLIRHTHWFTDLLGGLFIGSALLVAVIAVDRYVPSKSQLH